MVVWVAKKLVLVAGLRMRHFQLWNLKSKGYLELHNNWIIWMESFKKTMTSQNLGKQFEPMSTIWIVGKSKRVHPVSDILLQIRSVASFFKLVSVSVSDFKILSESCA